MFDVGFSELFIIAVVALLVLGPERLPKAARLAGLWVRKARAQWYSVKSELERELAAEELKRALSEPMQDAMTSLETARREFDAEAQQIGRGVGGHRRRHCAVHLPTDDASPDPVAAAPGDAGHRRGRARRGCRAAAPGITMSLLERAPEESLIGHLLELRSRLLKAVLSVLLVFVALLPFANRLYTWIAEPQIRALHRQWPDDRHRGHLDASSCR